MKTTNRTSLILIALVMAIGASLGGCATKPAFELPVYTGEVHNLVARKPEVGDVGTNARNQYVYTERGWVAL